MQILPVITYICNMLFAYMFPDFYSPKLLTAQHPKICPAPGRRDAWDSRGPSPREARGGSPTKVESGNPRGTALQLWVSHYKAFRLWISGYLWRAGLVGLALPVDPAGDPDVCRMKTFEGSFKKNHRPLRKANKRTDLDGTYSDSPLTALSNQYSPTGSFWKPLNYQQASRNHLLRVLAQFNIVLH